MGFRFKGSGYREAKTVGRGKYLMPGKHQLEVVRCYVNQGRNDMAFIADFRVLRTKPDSSWTGDEVVEEGDLRGWYQGGLGGSNVEKQQMAFSSIKAFAQALFGGESEYAEVIAAHAEENDNPAFDDEDLMDWIVDEANPLKGQILDVDCYMIKTKQGNDFTIHNYYPAGTFYEVEEQG